MRVVEVTPSISLDGFVTGPDPTAERPLGVGGDQVLRRGGERWMVEESFAEAGAVVAGRTVYDRTDGWGEEPPLRMPVFVPTHRPVLLGGCARLFDDIGPNPIRLERIRFVEGPVTTYVRFRVLR